MGWFTQSKDSDVHVKAKVGESKDTGRPTTEFIAAPRDGSGQHDHIVISDGGVVIHDTTGTA